jgi:predicted nucleotidyltransferase
MGDRMSTDACDPTVAAVSLAEARAIVRRIVGPFPVRVFLFGSRARGTSRVTSDIDIAILPTGPVPPSLVPELRDALEESLIPYHVDVVDLSRVEASFRAKVLSEGQPWDD